MSLQKCSDCKKKVSKNAVSCPNCGAPVVPQKEKKSGLLGCLIWATIIIAIVLFIAGYNPTKEKATYTTTPNTSTVYRPSTEPTNYAPKESLIVYEQSSDWPLTVTGGTLACRSLAVTYTYDGISYAVNGSASAKEYRNIDPIWKDNPIEYMEGTKISISGLIDRGLALCN